MPTRPRSCPRSTDMLDAISEGVYKTISRSHSRLFQLLIGGVRMESWTSAVRFQQEALPSSTVELRITVPPA